MNPIRRLYEATDDDTPRAMLAIALLCLLSICATVGLILLIAQFFLWSAWLGWTLIAVALIIAYHIAVKETK